MNDHIFNELCATYGMAPTKPLRDLVEAVWLRARQNQPAPMPAPPIHKRGCSVCGIGANGEALGYVCTRYDCPTKVNYGGTV